MLIRSATKEDLPAVLGLITEDTLSQSHEILSDPLPEVYYKAFDEIEHNPNQEVIVVEDDGGTLVGTFHLTFLRHLTYRGGLRAQIESVHIRADQRNQGIGTKAMQWAIQRARDRGAHLIQLTTNKQRTDAKRFYERLGFHASHEGMKLIL